MGLLDGVLGQVLGGGAQGNSGGQWMEIVQVLLQQSGGLNGLLQKLQQSGLADQAASWVGTGANQPVDARQIGDALGRTELADLAARFGLSQDQISGSLADLLPQVVDRLTPNGRVDQDGPSLGDLGGLLGGLLRR